MPKGSHKTIDKVKKALPPKQNKAIECHKLLVKFKIYQWLDFSKGRWNCFVGVKRKRKKK